MNFLWKKLFHEYNREITYKRHFEKAQLLKQNRNINIRLQFQDLYKHTVVREKFCLFRIKDNYIFFEKALFFHQNFLYK